MKKRTVQKVLGLLAFLFFVFFSSFSVQGSHPCDEVYTRCVALAFSLNLSYGQMAEWLISCQAMYVSCLVGFYATQFLMN